jgi:Cu-Zn family superoxide dismutase
MNRYYWTLAAFTIALAGCGAPETSQEAELDAGADAVDQLPPPPDPLEAEAEAETGDAYGVDTPASAAPAIAALQMGDGTPAGTATATPTTTGIMVSLQVQGLPPGEHGAHVHMIGQCDAPAFEGAGDHWNPTDAQHGLENPQGPHAGDMPNLSIDEDGQGALDYTLEGGSFDEMFDADGAAMVVHTMPDDQMADPAGNSGDRIACGVFQAG